MNDLERLLARHPDTVMAEPAAGRPALVRRGQVIVAHRDVDAVADAARRWLDRREDRPGACVLRLRDGADPCGIAADLGAYGRGHLVAPNHVTRAQPMWFSGPWGAPVPAAAAPAPTGTAAFPVTVAVPDTGLAAHPWWARRPWYADRPDEPIDDVPDGDGDGRLDPAAGHGTFVAGIVLRHAPTARLRAHRVLDGDGVGDEATLLDALADLDRDADVLCVASGCHTVDDRPSPLLTAAFARLHPACAVVACAGNDGGERPFWPAALDRVIAVGALDGAGERAEFSNHGPWVDACAPGVDVTSAFITFDGEPAFAGYARWSGTSFAAPAVAGEIANRRATYGEAASAAADVLLAAHGVVPGLGVPITSAAHMPTIPYEPQSTGRVVHR